MNNRRKMYQTNAKIRKWLISNDYKDIFFFLHTRFLKDYHFQGQEFDGIASKEKQLVLFQCKTNCRCPKKTLAQYDSLSKEYGIICLWINNRKKIGIEVNNEVPLR